MVRNTGIVSQDVISGLFLHVSIKKKKTQEASVILIVILYFIFQVPLTSKKYAIKKGVSPYFINE